MKETTRERIRIAIWLILISVIGYILLDDQVSDWLEHLVGLHP